MYPSPDDSVAVSSGYSQSVAEAVSNTVHEEAIQNKVGWVEERNPTNAYACWVSFLNPTYRYRDGRSLTPIRALSSYFTGIAAGAFV
ncbi:hypothetical protein [Coleofasciculus sp. H7-2]|uniref:hypothetical protein n=1 Tax=Coleofasciculus sp. H7-2 TaxID=3351545 RepID=UPI00366D7D58